MCDWDTSTRALTVRLFRKPSVKQARNASPNNTKPSISSLISIYIQDVTYHLINTRSDQEAIAIRLEAIAKRRKILARQRPI